MKNSKNMFTTIAASAILALSLCGCGKKAVVFPAPEGVAKSEHYDICADGQNVFAYATYRMDWNSKEKIANSPAAPLAFCIFDFEKDANVELKLPKGIIKNPSDAVVRPLALGIKPAVDLSNPNFDRVSLSLPRPNNYTFDPRGDGTCALHIFTNAPEKSRPDKNDPNVIYLGAGVHRIDKMKLDSNKTLYLEGGAVLLCSPKEKKGIYKVNGIELNNMKEPITLVDAENVTICGRGIISCAGSLQRGERMTPFRIRGVKNLTLRDIAIIEASEWNVSLYGAKDVLIDGLRILSYYVNSDGICPTSNCDNILVKNCFIHNADDAYELKAMDSYWGRKPKSEEKYFGDVRNVIFENCQVWNDLAITMGVTHEIGHNIENVAFKNITVLHHTSIAGPYPVRGHIAIFPAGGGKVSNMLFENIVLENDSSKYKHCIVINNTHGDSWRKNTPRYDNRPHSIVENITFRNIDFKNTKADKVGLFNHGKSDEIKNIRFENVLINGKKLTEKNIENRGAKFEISDSPQN